ncbi:tobamovirus multiplication protein 1-like [Chenopodium quinoa]|uniref:tobamovirus multiplication protein 1-like n=1 Tax=Chenopodium quinoa TaxID=63459 RepID=UPI000B797A24|nr:tobamovirus multiplication protein 1-like [Chenopodium quinoa]
MTSEFEKLVNNVGIGRLITSWWNEINDSVGWQDAIFFTLSALFTLISSVALVQLIRIELRVPEYRWTLQKVFHLMNFIVNGVRAIVFGLHKQVFILSPRVLMLVLLDLPGLLFFSTYTLLVLFWAEIDHQARYLPADKLRLVYILLNAGIYFIQVCIWIFLWLYNNEIVETVGRIFIAAVSLVAAISFLFYGRRLFLMLRQFPIESKGRSKKLYEVGSVAAVCFTCFLIRCIVVLVSAFDVDASLDVLDHPILDFFYYMLVEILPSALVLFILRKLPPKRISGIYHPIC